MDNAKYSTTGLEQAHSPNEDHFAMGDHFCNSQSEAR